MKNAPLSFVMCSLVGILIGAGVIYFLYSNFILPSKDAQISLLQQEKELLQSKLQNALSDKQEQIHPENVKITKQDIRTFLESVNPEILQKIDAGDKEISIRIGFATQMQLSELSKRPDYDKYLFYKKTARTIIGDGPAEGIIKELDENSTATVYYIYPKDALKN